MHDKVMIVDEKVVLTGSYNWSAHAENENNENLVVIISENLASIYENEFQKIWNTAH
jgi:phosphatidylserine/phosphatidylglycerophosphate/cardiolipin synthase-like enzyme